MLEDSIFNQLSLVIAIAAVIALIMRLLKQPLIMGYILTGIIVGPSLLDVVHSKEVFESFSEIGITLLLFIIGLGLNIGVIKSLGKVSVMAASSTFLLVGSVGLATSLLLGFDMPTGLVIGIGLFFSSTIIILKVLSDKREVHRLYGQIAIGVILVEDIVATLALVVIAALATTGGADVSTFATLGLKAFGLVTGLYIVGRYIMPRAGKFFAKSQELLFLFSISWGLGVATLFYLAGFSHEVGALFGGVALASLPYATEMASKLKPLRDFFIVIFFITLGEAFTFGSIQDNIVPALILSAIVMFGKPLAIMTSMGVLGYTKLTSFKTAIHLSQISEFSIILVIFAASTGLIGPDVVSIITLVALITIGISTYLMKYDDKLYRLSEPLLQIFERKQIRERKQKNVLYPIILFGYRDGGHEYLKVFREMKQRYLIVDYDPEVIEQLEHQGVRHAYGDATDDEFLEEVNAAKAQLVISTIPDIDTNKILISYLNRYGPKTTFICHALTYDEAAELYRHGASYVIIPHYLGTERISSFIKKHGFNPKAFDDYRDNHLITIGKQALKG